MNNKQPMNNKYPKENFNQLINQIKEGLKKGGLSKALTCEDINLPNGIAYKIGMEFGNKNKNGDENVLNTNQLRKYFEEISYVSMLSNFDEQKTNLYKILPKIAYAVGRKVCPSNFYELMNICISDAALKHDDDIQTLIDFLTSIVAYSKYQSI